MKDLASAAGSRQPVEKISIKGKPLKAEVIDEGERQQEAARQAFMWEKQPGSEGSGVWRNLTIISVKEGEVGTRRRGLNDSMGLAVG